MALINCPKCGKQVSDTAEKCIHCGADLRESEPPKEEVRMYYKLPSKEQDDLRQEFYKTNANYEKNDVLLVKQSLKTLITHIIRIISGVLTLLILVIGQIYHVATGNNATISGILFGIFLLITVIALILNIIFRRGFNKLNRNHLIITKRFQKWLLDEKRIKYVAQFTNDQDKDKKFYDSIDVEKTQLEE